MPSVTTDTAAEAELERMKAERDEERDAIEDWRRLADEHRDEKLAVEARLDKALAALREIVELQDGPHDHPQGLGIRRAVIARAAIVEIEGEET